MKPEEIYETAQESVITITTYDSKRIATATGSGVLISQDGVVVSNYHVLEGCHDFTITAGEIIITDADVIAFDSDKDLVLIKMKRALLKPIKLCEPKDIKIGQIVYTLGNPLGEFDNTFSAGLISGIRKSGNSHMYIQFTAPISPGNSGGALLNEKCELIGITTMSRRDGNDLYFAMPVEMITELHDSKSNYLDGECKLLLLANNALSAGEYVRSNQLFDELLNINTNSIEARMGRAMALLSLNKHESAIKEFELAGKISPDNEEVFFGIAESHKGLDNHKEAYKYYTKAISSNPDNSRFYYSRGWLLVKMGEFEASILDFDKAIELSPFDPRPYYDRAVAFKTLGKLEQAEDNYIEAIRLDEENFMYWVELSETKEMLGQLTMAIHCLESAIELEFHNNDLLLRRGRLWHKLGHYHNALFDYSRLLEREESNVSAMVDRARTYIELGNYSRAELDLFVAMKINPEDSMVNYTFGDLCYKNEDKNEAMKHLTKSIEVEPNFDAYFLRGLIHEEMGKKKEALNDLKKCLDLNSEAYEALKGVLGELQG